MQDLSEQRRVINVVLVGDEASGKTHFFNLYCPSTTLKPQEYVSTIGAECRIKSVSKGMFSNSDRKLNIWDTSGQARFKKITQAYYHDANIVLYFVDASVELNKQNIEHINAWLSDINSKAKVGGSVIVVLAKSDLVSKDAIEAKKTQLDDIIKCWNEKNRHQIIFSGAIISSKTRFGIQELENTLLTFAKKTPRNPTMSVPLYKMQKNLSKTEGFIKKHLILLSVLIGFSAAVILAAAGIFAPLGVSALGVICFGILIGFSFFALSYQVKNAKCFETTSIHGTPGLMSHERMKPRFDLTPDTSKNSDNKQLPNPERYSIFTPVNRTTEAFETLSDDNLSDGSEIQISFV